MSFVPFSSHFSPSFWSELTRYKLEVAGLSDDAIAIEATYARGKMVWDRTGAALSAADAGGARVTEREEIAMGASLEFDSRSFEKAASTPGDVAASARGAASDDTANTQPSTMAVSGKLSGILRNYNTIEEFKKADKVALLNSLGDDIWRLCGVEADHQQASMERLNPFLLLTFADLKKYRYYYWCGFPALLQKPGWELDGDEVWQTLDEDSSEIQHYKQKRQGSSSHSACSLVKVSADGSCSMSPIDQFSSFFQDVLPSKRTIIFLDSSTHSQSPSWPLRNVLTYLSTRHTVNELRVIRFRDTNESCVAVLRRKAANAAVEGENAGSGDVAIESRPSVVGWEKNAKGALGPKMADLAPLLDPAKLADQAVDLNLQLMRWRIMPELDLEKIKRTKVLLLGAGTLGCYVSRTLMAWGVRQITFVDSSTVSFSNPVRQPLFEFVDSLQGGKPKAEAAARALKRIYPGVEATGIQLSIPMPGHPIPPSQLERTRSEVEQLEKLIDEHDVVYLLMDSRESRWLPTMIGASKRKLVMNVALGFDTYLIMRHGVPLPSAASDADAADEKSTKAAQSVAVGKPFTGRLGCYYCNDIVAPMDSLTDRTLDQMCTVTRPGIAGIASATAVELMVSVLQHPLGKYAPSDIPIVTTSSSSASPTSSSTTSAKASPLGIVPHQLRGYLSEFNTLKITGQSYDRCTGCSALVTSEYESLGFSMIERACADASYLERITGLDQLALESEAAMEGVDWDEDEDDDEE